MNGSPDQRSSWRVRASWALRKYLFVVVAGAAGLGIALPLVTSTSESYRAQTVVVVRERAIDPVVVPSYASAVFASDAMRLRAASAAGSPGGAVAADRLRLVPTGADTWSVEARAQDPLAAAALADAVAEAFVEELNRAGGDVGTFSIAARAGVPTTSSSTGPPGWAAAAVGVAAGAVLGLLLVAVVVGATRPVLRARDVTSAAGQRLIGVVTLPADRGGRPSDPADAYGLAAVSAVLLPLVDASVVLVSRRQLTAQRRQLIILLARAMAPVRDVFVSGSPDLAAEATRAMAGAGADAAGTPRPGLELVDGVAPLETLEVPQWPLPLVLVIRYGEPSAALRRLAADSVGDEMLGVVMVDQRRSGVARRPRKRSPASPATA
ncbi:MAG: hypothetical protein H0T66_02870 [Geodermatophilaceae bacterium]|nr:hypothetical protein [Geodermatophilaceae bacterium]MDQ3456841.1 hypothetical protein [Actinomycetota bacterium]